MLAHCSVLIFHSVVVLIAQLFCMFQNEDQCFEYMCLWALISVRDSVCGHSCECVLECGVCVCVPAGVRRLCTG